MAHEDAITLGGQSFFVKEMSRGGPVSEFQAGIKIGKATYDDREHAFFLVLDDFSGGFGHRRLDIREELGTFWDADQDNPADLRRAGHMTLPPAINSITPATFPTALNYLMGIKPSYPSLSVDGIITLFGAGSSIYYTGTYGLVWTEAFDKGANVGDCMAIVRMVGKDASMRYFAAFRSAAQDERYVVSSNALTWANGAVNKSVTDLFVWDNKLLAAYHPGGFASSSPSAIIFAVLTAGVESWNIDDANDGEYIAIVPGNYIQFVGVATAPWGEPAVYFLANSNLYVLDFFARKAYPIEMGQGNRLRDAKIWNDEIVTTDGFNCYVYSPAGGTVRNIGLPRKDGLPPSLHSANYDIYAPSAGWRLRCLIPADIYLFALMVDFRQNQPIDVVNRTRLYCYNGVGWQQIGQEIDDFYSHSGFHAVYTPATFNIGQLVFQGYTGLSSVGTALRFKTINLPEMHQIPIHGVTAFGSSGASWMTGWIDGGFNDLSGALLRMTIDAFHLTTTETVIVEYRLDNDEDASWIRMVDTNNAADAFDNTTRALYFSATVPARGVEFRTVQFRFTFTRSGTATATPEVKAFTLVYNKKPTFRSQWTFSIDVNRMIEVGTLVDGVAATMANVWAKLKSLWNTQPLIPLIIPNIEPSPGINVLLTGNELAFDDFRDAVDGKGSVTLTVLEPVV